MDELKKALIRFSLSLNEIYVLVGNMENLIEHSKKEFKQKGIRSVQSQEGDSPLEEEVYTYGGYWSYIFEDVFDQFHVFLPYRMRSSVLLTIFGMFEGEMDSLATLMLKKKEMPFALNNFMDKGIVRSYRCIRKLLNMTHCQEWNEFNIIINLRNIAAHNNSLIMRKDFGKENHLDQLISNKIIINTEVYGDGNDNFIFTEQSLFEVHCLMNKLFQKIRKEIEVN